MNIAEALKIFEDISGLELYNSEWSKVKEALSVILIKLEEESREAWDEGVDACEELEV
jgi:hypothetical protein